MQRESAFKPKIQEVEGSAQEIEKTEGPLQSLEKDRSQIFAFNFSLEALLSGELTEARLQALIDPNAKFDSDGDLLVNGTVILIKGACINKRDIESKRPTQEDIQFLTRLLSVVKNPSFPDEVKESQMLGLQFNEEKNTPVSREVIEAVKVACTDDDFQKYAFVALKKKRRNPRLDIVLSFKNGFVDPRTTFVQN